MVMEVRDKGQMVQFTKGRKGRAGWRLEDKGHEELQGRRPQGKGR